MSSLLNHPWALTWLATLLAYLVGSLSFAVIVSRLMGLHDPRTYGSKNPGATNVLRSGSKKAAVLTLLMDAVKGWVPVMLVKLHGPAYGLGDGTLALVALGAFLGHLWPVFFRFQGGKGVATAAGVLIGLQPLLGLATALTWVTVAYVSRYSSLAALAASVLAPSLSSRRSLISGPRGMSSSSFQVRVQLSSSGWLGSLRSTLHSQKNRNQIDQKKLPTESDGLQ